MFGSLFGSTPPEQDAWQQQYDNQLLVNIEHTLSGAVVVLEPYGNS